MISHGWRFCHPHLSGIFVQKAQKVEALWLHNLISGESNDGVERLLLHAEKVANPVLNVSLCHNGGVQWHFFRLAGQDRVDTVIILIEFERLNAEKYYPKFLMLNHFPFLLLKTFFNTIITMFLSDEK